MAVKKRLLNVVLATVFASGAIAAGSAAARQLNFAIGQPPGAIAVTAGELYADTVKSRSGGKLSVKVYPLSLLNMAETSPGLREGMADIGMVLTQYTPAEYPHNNLISEATMLLRLLGDKVRGKEAMAYAGALSEFTMLHCPECNQEFARQNQVYSGAGTGSSYGLVCNKPVASAADLRGKRLRVGASQWARWSKVMAATPVTMTGNEMYEALSQGAVDCIVVSAPEIHNFGLIDVITDMTTAVPGGIFTTAVANVNSNVWRSLDAEQRNSLLRASAEMAAFGAIGYHRLERDVLAAAEKKGIRFHDADPELIEQTQQFIEQDMQTMADYYARAHGITRSTEILTAFRSTLEKWADLVQDIDSANALADLYWQEVYAKIDVNTHGL